MNRFEYVHASSLQAAQRQLTSDGKVMLKAGGVDLVDMLKERLIAPKRLVNLNTVSGLDQIQKDAKTGALKIGALVHLSTLAEDATVKAHAPALAQAAGLVATPQIRHMATLGGNLCQRPRCWYFRSEAFHCFKKGGSQCFAQTGDNTYHAIFQNMPCAIVHPSGAAVALVALGAKLHIFDGAKQRTVDIADFFTLPTVDIRRENILKPTEIITSVEIPKPSAQERSLYIKQKQKESFDWPLAELAVSLELQGGKVKQATIVLGAAAPIPWRAKAVEKAIVGQPLDQAHAKTAAKLVRQGARVLSHNGYKLDLFEALIEQAMLTLAQPTTAAPTSKPTERR